MLLSRLLPVAAIVLVAILGCSRGPTYEEDFGKFADDLSAKGMSKDTAAETDAREKRLEEGAPEHKAFLIGQLKANQAEKRWLACSMIPVAKAQEAGPQVLEVAKSDPDAIARMSAVDTLGHLEYKGAEDYIRSIVVGPKRMETRSAIVALYHIDPTGAVSVFKERVEQPDVRQPKRGQTKLLMAA